MQFDIAAVAGDKALILNLYHWFKPEMFFFLEPFIALRSHSELKSTAVVIMWLQCQGHLSAVKHQGIG